MLQATEALEGRRTAKSIGTAGGRTTTNYLCARGVALRLSLAMLFGRLTRGFVLARCARN